MASVAGVFAEVPVMLDLVKIAIKTQKWFDAEKKVI
jgi:ACR3 family arsenite efflux pump ArsB